MKAAAAAAVRDTCAPKEAHLAAGTGYCLTGLLGFGARFPVARVAAPNMPSLHPRRGYEVSGKWCVRVRACVLSRGCTYTQKGGALCKRWQWDLPSPTT